MANGASSAYLKQPMARTPTPPANTDTPLDPPAGRTPAGSMDSPHGADRFNEDKARYALRGADQPDIDLGVAVIREVVATLKPVPGVYRMTDARGDVLYVGKARALKNRVANYVQVDRLPNRLRRMVSLTRTMTIVTTNSEAEALLLEAQKFFVDSG